MNGHTFLAIWAAAIVGTALIVGWTFLMTMVVFPHSTALAVVSGLAVPIALLMGVSWIGLRS